MPPHPLTNFEIQKYYQKESKFNGVYSRNNLPKIEDGAYIINLDEYESIGTHWIGLYVNDNKVTYFDSFGVEQKKLKEKRKQIKKSKRNPKEIKKFIRNKNVVANIYRIQAHNSIMCRYICWFHVKRLKFIWDTNLFSPNDYEKNDKITLKHFQ